MGSEMCIRDRTTLDQNNFEWACDLLESQTLDPMQALWLIQNKESGRLRLSQKESTLLQRLSLISEIPKSGWGDQAEKLLFAEKVEKNTGKEFTKYFGKFWETVNARLNLTISERLGELIKTDHKKGFLRRQKPPMDGHAIANKTGLSGKELGDAVEQYRRQHLNETTTKTQYLPH